MKSKEQTHIKFFYAHNDYTLCSTKRFMKAITNNCYFLGKNKDPILMNMAPGMEHVSADKEFVKNSNRISTILSNNTRPGKKN